MSIFYKNKERIKILQRVIIVAMIVFSEVTVIKKMVVAFAFSLLGTLLVMNILKKIKFKNVIFIPLIRIMVGKVIGSLAEFVAYKFNVVQDINAFFQGKFAMVIISGTSNQVSNIGTKSWIFLILSGLSTGASWLFYYKALQIGQASKVVPIDKFSVVIIMIFAFVILKETITLKTIIGGIFITIGTFVMIL